MNTLILQDLDRIVSCPNIQWENFSHSRVLVTGASGIIGSFACKTLLHAAQVHGIPINVIGIVRDKNKALQVFSEYTHMMDKNFFLLAHDVQNPIEIKGPITHIIHAASPTSSRYFVDSPVETFISIVQGTNNILKLAYEKQCASVLYVSSMEVYGHLDHETVKETDLGFIDITSKRSSYPQGKRAAETLCTSYYHEYGVPVKIVRPTLTFGFSVAYDDSRVFAQFARSVVEGRDITLMTKGETKRDYVYTSDAICAMLIVLLHGNDSEVYNISNETTYCSIYELAEQFCNHAENTCIKLLNNSSASSQYPNTIKISLDCEKLFKLGWRPEVGMEAMVNRLVNSFKAV